MIHVTVLTTQELVVLAAKNAGYELCNVHELHHVGRVSRIFRAVIVSPTAQDEPVIIKTYKKQLQTQKDIVNLRKEFDIVKSLSGCAHVVDYKEFLTAKIDLALGSRSNVVNFAAIMMEDANATDFNSYILKNSPLVDIGKFLDIAIQLFTGLQEIHEHHIIHKV